MGKYSDVGYTNYDFGAKRKSRSLFAAVTLGAIAFLVLGAWLYRPDVFGLFRNTEETEGNIPIFGNQVPGPGGVNYQGGEILASAEGENDQAESNNTSSSSISSFVNNSLTTTSSVQPQSSLFAQTNISPTLVSGPGIRLTPELETLIISATLGRRVNLENEINGELRARRISHKGDVTAASNRITLAGRTDGAVLTSFSVDVNEGALQLANFSGTLPVTSGGTGTNTAFTQGSVVFAGPSGTYAQDNANFFWDDTNNRLGIGIASPTEKLEVNGTLRVGTADDSGIINLGDTLTGSGNYTNGFFRGGLNSLTGGGYLNLNAWNGIVFNTSGAFFGSQSTRMVIDGATGNVGIGDTSPAALFTVGSGDVFRIDSNGDIIRIKNLTYSWPTTHETNGVLINDGTGVLAWGTLGGGSITPNSLDFTEFQPQMDLDTSTDILVDGTELLSVTNTGTNNSFQVNDEVGDTTPFVIDDEGNVGIGTSSPAAKLAVSGAANLGSELITNGTFTGNANGWDLEDCGSYASNQVTVTYTACSWPAIHTDVTTTSGATYALTFTLSSVSVGEQVYIYSYNGLDVPGSNEYGNGTHTVYVTGGTTGTDTLVFESNTYNSGATWTIDDVSLRLISVAPALTVAGFNGDTYLSIAGDVNQNTGLGRNALGSTTSGAENVAIGDYAGTAITSGYQNSILGFQAGTALTTGGSNVFVGYQTGYSTTTATFNTFVGYRSGYANTASNNSFFGYSSGLSNTSGSSNTFLGVQAGRSNTTASGNTFVGLNSGYNTTTGGLNSFFGYLSGQANTTGLANAFFGSSAGLVNTEGFQNTFLGYEAGRANTDADDNTFVGSYAGRSNTTASQSTWVGTGAGYNSTGANNTGLGYHAGFLNAAGANNIFLGHSAGDNITSGSNNIVLGYNIDATVATGSNQLNIGNIVFGTSIDGTGTTLSTGNIGIGDATPAAKFTVGNGDLFQVNSSGAIAAATGITSSGTITFSALTANRLVATTTGGALTTTITAANLQSSVTGTTGNGNLVFATSPTITGLTISSGGLSVTGDSTFTGHLLPGVNDTYDLGSNSFRWRDLYLGGETINIGTSTTDQGIISYTTSTNLFNFSTDSTSNGDIAFFSDDLYLDKSTGFVGVGTTAPDVSFQVHRSAGQTDLYISTDVNVGSANTAQLSFVSDRDGTPSYSSIGQFNTGDLRFSANGNLVSPHLTILNSGGNVGIGTTTPAQKLQVFGTSNPTIQVGGGVSQGTTGGSSTFRWRANNGTVDNIFDATYYKDTGVDRLTFIDGGANNVLTLENGGNVGIGTTNPGYLLDVDGDVQINNIWEFNQSGVFNWGSGYAHGTITWDTGFAKINAQGSNALKLYAASGGIDILSSGNVGIGTTAPTASLEIYGASQTTAALTDAGARTGILALNSSATAAGNGGTITFGNIQSIAAGSVGFAAIKGLLTDGGGNTVGDLAFSTRNTTAATALAERMRILSTGEVGIGTTSPGAKLDVRNARTSGANAVGLILSDPVTGAQTGGFGTLLRFSSNSGQAIAEIMGGQGDASGDGTNNQTQIRFRTQPSAGNIADRMTITSVGYIGIGVTAPITQFSNSTGINTGAVSTSGINWRIDEASKYAASFKNISGTGYGVHIEAGAASNGLIVESGRVGIGTTSPQTKLHISDLSNPVDLRVTAGGAGYTAPALLLESVGAADTRGQGVFMLDTLGGQEWYAGTGYSNTDQYIIARQAVGSHDGSTAQGGFSFLTVTNTGQVGIGSTTSAATRLMVYHNSSVGGASDSAFTVRQDGTDAIARFLGSGGTSRVTVLSDGTVGIGTATPDRLLTFNATTNASYISMKRAGNAGMALGVDSVGGWIAVSNNNPLSFYNDSAEIIRITDGGNVGIGTTGPNAKLEVSVAATNATVLQEVARLARTGGSTTGGNGRAALLGFYDGDNPTLTAAIGGIRINSSSTYNGALGFYTYTPNGLPATDVSSLSERMRISEAGNVGINTTTPTAGRLSIVQNTDPGTTPSALDISLSGVSGGTATSQYGIKVSGGAYNNSTNVYGIHSSMTQQLSSPTYGLYSEASAVYASGYGVYGKGHHGDINGPAIVYGVYGSATSAGAGSGGTTYAGYFYNQASLGAGAVGTYIASVNGNPLIVSNGTTERLRVDSGGDLGIGTTNPLRKLVVSNGGAEGIEIGPGEASAHNYFVNYNRNSSSYVAETHYASAYNFIDASSNYLLSLDANGNTGVGTSSPYNFGSTYTSLTIGSGSRDGIIKFQNGYNSGNGAEIYQNDSGTIFIDTNSSTAVVSLTSTGALRLWGYGAGTLTTDASGNVTASSDERLKNVQGNFSRGLSALQNIQPIAYKWKSSSGLDRENVYYGFSAQNIRANIPEAIGEDPRGFLTLSDRPILATVINATKELNSTVIANRGVADESAQTLAGQMLALEERAVDLSASVNEALQSIKDLESDVSALKEQVAALQAAGGSGNENGIFQNGLSVIGASLFEGLASFTDAVFFEKTVTFAEDAAGTATLPIGETEIAVSFENAYLYTPVVTVTPRNFLAEGNYRVSEESESGFTISVSQAQTEEIEFSWIAIQKREE